MESLIDKSLVYKSVQVAHGTHVLSRTVQQSGSTTQALDVSGGGTSVFEIAPGSVINLSKSVLSFRLTPTAGGANLYNKMFVTGAPMIRSIQLTTREGLHLCDLQDANKFLSAVVLPSISYGELLESEAPSGTANSSVPSIGYGHNTSLVGPQAPRDDVGTTLIGTGIRNICHGPAVDQASPVIDWSLSLSIFKNTILSQDLNHYFAGQSVFLTITWAPFTSLGFVGSSTTAVNTAIADLVGAGITNMYFYQSLEQNAEAIQLARVPRTIQIPFVYTNKLALTGASHTVNVRYSRSHGSKLRQLYWVPFNQVTTAGYQFDHSNVFGSASVKMLSFNTQLNNIRLQPFDLSSTYAGGFTDFLFMKRYLKGTALSTPLDYYRNWFYLDSFIVDQNHNEIDTDDSFDLSAEDVLYTVSCTPGAVTDLNHHVFAVTQRSISTHYGRITMT